VNRALIFPALLLTLAAAPAPLVVGSVRDQAGAPIAGALISAGGSGSTTTAPDGTFALEVAGVSALRITCAYCRPLEVTVRPSEPVVAIVQRYAALSDKSPSARDIRALPYSHAESVLSLRPFAVLTDTRSFLPGPRVADRWASAQGGAIVDDGIPDYDIAANVSMLPALPLFDLKDADIFSAGQTAYNGDQAAGGIFFLNDLPRQGSDSSFISGSDFALRNGAFGNSNSYAVAGSGNTAGSRARAAANFTTAAGGDPLEFSFLAAHARDVAPAVSSNGLEGFRAQYSRVRANALTATFIADRAGYATSFASAPLSAQWADLVGELTVTSQTPVQIFGDFGVRQSSGSYNADAFRLRIAGTVAQTHIDTGAQTRGDRYEARAAIGAYQIAYNGGTGGVAVPMQTQALIPSLYASYDISPQWNVALYAGSSFRLPTLLEAYGTRPLSSALQIDRYAQFTQTLSYTDLKRITISVTSMSEGLSSLDAGVIHSAGASIAWQIAPEIALRAWTLWFDDGTQPSVNLLRFGRAPQYGTPGSVWLTYESQSGLRIDTIYRSDFLDALPQRHIDASISGPFARGLRWFVSTEKRQDARTIDAGIKFEQP
jgi:hypothetical protein